MINSKSFTIILTEDIYASISNDLTITRTLRLKIIRFLSLLIEKGLRKDKLFRYYNFQSIFLKTHFGDRYYRRVIIYCSEAGYIFINEKYSSQVNEYSTRTYTKSYRLNKPFYKGQLCRLSITTGTREQAPNVSVQ